MSSIAAQRATNPLFRHLTRKNLGWGVLFILSLIVLVMDIGFLSPHHPYRWYHLQVRTVLLPHIILGCVAILAGPIQFSSRVRRAYPLFHKLLGRAYVLSILIAAPMGALIPILGPKDRFFTIGVGVHAFSWFVTTLMAFLTARNRNIAQHRQWMIRSYVLTFSFVLTRTVVLPITILVTPHQFGLIDVINNFFYIFAADVAMSWRELTTIAPQRAECKAARVVTT